MADQYSNEDSSKSSVAGESSDTTVDLNVKTLDSQIYSFHVEKNMLVSVFKEKIANEIGVPVSQQRLIFRGRVLKDEHLLSDYQVENGHTLHLVERQPSQSQPSGDASSGDTSRNSDNRGNDANAGGPRNRVGQISHSVVLGTFNVGDQGEGIIPDLNRVIGAVLNSFGIGGQTGVSQIGGQTVVSQTGGQTGVNNVGGLQSSSMSNFTAQAPQGNETLGSHGNISGQNQMGNQAQSGQAFPSQPFQSPPEVLQIPLAAAAPVPPLHLPIPDSLSTLSEFMTRMEQTLAQNGYQLNTTSSSTRDQPRVELPATARGLPTPEALAIILRQAERLLSGHTISALSHLAGRLEQEASSNDRSVRGQIQSESVQVGMTMQHLGALLLELGRTILTLRMGQSPAESAVNPGPAVYISSSGPNPIMVQPFPLQTNSLFGGSAPPSNPLTFGPAGIGNAARNINIHIHAGTSLAPVVSTLGARSGNGEGTLGERGVGVGSLSNVFAEINSRLRNAGANLQGENSNVSRSVESRPGNDAGNEQPPSATASSGSRESGGSTHSGMPESDGSKRQDQDVQVQASIQDARENLLSSKDESCSVGSSSVEPSVKLENSLENAPSSSESHDKNAPSSSERHDSPDGAKAAPLGLGLGGLERKKRTRQPKSDNEMAKAPINQDLSGGVSAEQVLQSLASHGTSREAVNDSSSVQLPASVGRTMESRPPTEQHADGQFDAADIMSQVIRSPALDGLLTGFSEQTGVGSPNMLRNMLQQLTGNPQIMSTVGQIAQQVERQDAGNLFSGQGGGQGGGLDLSRMVQQMMPVVSQFLGQGSAVTQSIPGVEPEAQRQSDETETRRTDKPTDQSVQIDLQQVAQRIEHLDTPRDVFHAVIENAVRLNGNESSQDDIVQDLGNNEALANDYIEMLRRDIGRRLQGDSEHEH